MSNPHSASQLQHQRFAVRKAQRTVPSVDLSARSILCCVAFEYFLITRETPLVSHRPKVLGQLLGRYVIHTVTADACQASRASPASTLGDKIRKFGLLLCPLGSVQREGQSQPVQPSGSTLSLTYSRYLRSNVVDLDRQVLRSAAAAYRIREAPNLPIGASPRVSRSRPTPISMPRVPETLFRLPVAYSYATLLLVIPYPALCWRGFVCLVSMSGAHASVNFDRSPNQLHARMGGR